jgi:hypothetical protein
MEQEQAEQTVERAIKGIARKLLFKACKGDYQALLEDLVQAGWEGFLRAQYNSKCTDYAIMDARKSIINTWCRWNWQASRGSKTEDRPEEIALTEDLEPSYDFTDEAIAKNLVDRLRVVIWTNSRGSESKLAND